MISISILSAIYDKFIAQPSLKRIYQVTYYGWFVRRKSYIEYTEYMCVFCNENIFNTNDYPEVKMRGVNVNNADKIIEKEAINHFRKCKFIKEKIEALKLTDII